MAPSRCLRKCLGIKLGPDRVHLLHSCCLAFPMSEIAPVLVFRSLFANDLVSVRQYQCRACRGGPAPEEQTQSCDVVFMLRGAFCRYTSQRKYNLVDVNHVAFFSPSEPYQVSHPANFGDDGTVVTLSSSLLHDIIRPLCAEVDDKPDRPFLRQIGPCSDQQSFPLQRRRRPTLCKRGIRPKSRRSKLPLLRAVGSPANPTVDS